MKSPIPFLAAALCLCAAPLFAQFKTVGYFPNWATSAPKFDFSRLTHINYAFVVPFPDASLTSINEGRVKWVVDPAHAAGVKVSIAIGGWNGGDSKGFIAMSADPALRATFVKNIMDLIEFHKFDGADVDWEYPKDAATAANFVLLMKDLSAALKPKGLLLTAAVADLDYSGQWIKSEVFGYIDMLYIMAYDAGGGGNPNIHHSPYTLAESALAYWRGRGCPKEKTVLGVPFYGRSPETPYNKLVEMDPQAPYKDIVGNIRYNGIATIQAKTQLAYQQGGGVMIWDLTHDTLDSTSLLKAIQDKVKTFPSGIWSRNVAGAPLFQIVSPDLIRFQAPRQGTYVLSIHSASGRMIRELSAAAGAGEVEFRWNGGDLSSGIYEASIRGQGFARSRQVILP